MPGQDRQHAAQTVAGSCSVAGFSGSREGLARWEGCQNMSSKHMNYDEITWNLERSVFVRNAIQEIGSLQTQTGNNAA